MQFTLPSKSFLFGEYGALCGSAAYILIHAPYFKCHIQNHSQNLGSVFHPQSPAGRFYQKHKTQLQGVQIEFNDPHKGRGGFGASSAQFICVYKLAGLAADKSASPVDARGGGDVGRDDVGRDDVGGGLVGAQTTIRSMDLKHLVSEYQKCHPVGRNFLPSGYDCIAQVVGGDQIDQVVGGDPSTLGVVDIKAAKWQSWPFEHVEVLLFSTGLKIKTHNYVSQLQPGTWCDDFLKQQSQFEQQWQQAFTSWPLMCVAVNEWAQFLEKHQLVVPEAQKILNHVRQQKHVQAAKACGAAGADVICVLCEKKYASAVLDSLEGLGLQAI